jgi:hypothetical protein
VACYLRRLPETPACWGREGGPIADIAKYVDTAHEQKEFAGLAELPIDALQGISKADAEAIQQAFGVKTIRQLAENWFVRAAQAITLLAGPK